MATRTTERRQAENDTHGPATTEQSWARHEQVLELVEQIRRNRVRRPQAPADGRRPTAR